MHKRRNWIVTLCSLATLAPCMMLFGCRDSEGDSQAKEQYDGSYPIRAVVTVGMVADLVREIGGPQAQVKQLLGSGVDPHLYKATRDDVQAILSSDIIFYNGLLLEGNMAEMLARSSGSRATCAVGSLLKLPAGLAGANPHHPDPHVWMDVSLWSQATEVVGDVMSQFDPPHAEEYLARTQAFRQQLDRLHEYGRFLIGSIPQERRVLITSHDAFRYFGNAYGLEVQAVQGISTESEAGLQRINELVDLLVDRKIDAVFVESSVPKESIEALLEGAHSRGQTVKIGGELYSDAMGTNGTYAGTYIGMMDHNLTTIARALGSTSVPQDGFKGFHP